MLYELTIENVAVIEKATVPFAPGLNVLTGETGAGKSILIDSINAILGNRTSKDIVRSGAAKASIWAAFQGVGPAVSKALEEAGYEPEEELLLQREITADGKSSCRINGRPATAAIVRDICASLITIHGQHDNQSLLNPSKHLSILDRFAQNEELLARYTVSFRALRDIDREMRSLTMDEEEKQRKTDLLNYQVNEIDAADLTPGEEEELQGQRNRIRHSQKILQALAAAYGALSGGDDFGGAVDLLGGAKDDLAEIIDLSADFEPVSSRLSEAFYTVQDLSLEIKDLLDSQESGSANLDEIEQRLDLIYRLKHKYGDSVVKIIEYGENARQELNAIRFSGERLERLSAERAAALKATRVIADQLTDARLAAFEHFSAQISSELEFLNMPGIVLALQREKTPLSSTGQDSVEFLLSANRGEQPRPLSRIASGGELSRITLAIKSVLADRDDIGTLIYDEIDTGVSGLAAGRIGQKLAETAMGHQIICVTHTPQIAAYAHCHLLIEKAVKNDRTYTRVVPLEEDGRKNELARIISGDKVTPLALANAEELLKLSHTEYTHQQ